MTQKQADAKTTARTGQAAASPPASRRPSGEGKGSDASPPEEMGAEDESPTEAHHSKDTTAKPDKKPK